MKPFTVLSGEITHMRRDRSTGHTDSSPFTGSLMIPLAKDEAAALGLPGLTVTVPVALGSTTSYRATAEAEGVVSACSSAISYKQEDPPPPPEEEGTGGSPEGGGTSTGGTTGTTGTNDRMNFIDDHNRIRLLFYSAQNGF